jgi:alpha-1,2-mannosyltransferase
MTSAARTRLWLRVGAWGFWLLVFAGIGTDVIRHPLSHTTSPVYRTASTFWWQARDIYAFRDHDGFFYFPSAAFLFSPFNLIPSYYAGEILWRLFNFGLFAFALVRLNEVFLSGTRKPDKTFLVLMLLAIPSAFASLRNAQFDLPVAALVVLAAMEVASLRWNAATFWLCLAVAFKPLAVVPLLLFGALYWKLIPRLLLGLLIVVALPFAHWSPAFVAQEYLRCFQNMAMASRGEGPRYSELASLLNHAGITPPDLWKTIARIFFALVYLGLGAAAVTRLAGYRAAWTVGALAADYLMLFNPRTETCSYVFLGPFIASLALFYSRESGHKWLSYILGFGALGLACDAFPKIGTFSIHDMTDRWFKPLIAVIFFLFLIHFVFTRRAASPKTM